jgi:hypothetical protein
MAPTVEQCIEFGAREHDDVDGYVTVIYLVAMYVTCNGGI